ncbi:hypothetical protein SAMN05216364_102921 [Porphyromonadaceae bacterium KHP3R9]|nr:hypothetical protein SAMN05216364_102921 [Porphyromonadaceae bacterium KHP3R9]
MCSTDKNSEINTSSNHFNDWCYLLTNIYTN